MAYKLLSESKNLNKRGSGGWGVITVAEEGGVENFLKKKTGGQLLGTGKYFVTCHM